jgi:magnesium chelatase subunit I
MPKETRTVKPSISTLKELKSSGYKSIPVKEEIRKNLIEKLKNKQKPFEGIWGYEETVIPDLERAILSRHNINLLGLRGQAKTRLARLMAELLDEYIPAIEGTDLNDDPFNPVSGIGKQIIAEKGELTPIHWIHRSERYTEKLATPDVSVADLIGDSDPIKAASLRLPYSDERVIHYGLIPRSNRGIFVINELPDLQPRIQVALFNILQEGDIQIRGFKMRLPLDIQFIFTANPEDYTNRGSIVTPLKDRIDSQIITHYPKTIEIGKKITSQEAHLKKEQTDIVQLNTLAYDLIEQVAMEARESEFVDAKSGVSARLTISALENLVSSAERRALLNNESRTFVRASDFYAILPSITGKVELVYEGEQEGSAIVAQNLLGKAIRSLFKNHFPDPEKERKLKEQNNYKKITDWFGAGNQLDLFNDSAEKEYYKTLDKVTGLKELVEKHVGKVSQQEKYFLMEFALHGLAEYSLISKNGLSTSVEFRDLLSSMFSGKSLDDDETEEDDDSPNFKRGF